MNAMNRRHNTKVPALLLLLAAVLLVAVTAGCERKVEGTVSTESPVSDACFDCHNGQQDAQQGEWAHSVHASGENVDYTSREGSDCVRCHQQDGFIHWVNTGTLLPNPGNAKAIGCFACHNPHENGNFALRSSGPVTLVTGDIYDVGASNLCARCHQGRGTDPNTIVDGIDVTSNRYGPHHGPQGDLLNGTIGYESFPGFVKGESLHRSVVTDGCKGCHMNYANSHAGYEVGGHSVNMKDEAGNDLAANCTDAACHGAGTLQFDDPVTSEPYDFILTSAGGDGYQTIVQQKLDSLQILLEIAGIYNPANGRNFTGVFADGNVVGAYWNWEMIKEDRSLGIHNFQYVNSLLDASIAYLAP
jgi:hypothetical protein